MPKIKLERGIRRNDLANHLQRFIEKRIGSSVPLPGFMPSCPFFRGYTHQDVCGHWATLRGRDLHRPPYILPVGLYLHNSEVCLPGDLRTEFQEKTCNLTSYSLFEERKAVADKQLS